MRQMITPVRTSKFRRTIYPVTIARLPILRPITNQSSFESAVRLDSNKVYNCAAMVLEPCKVLLRNDDIVVTSDELEVFNFQVKLEGCFSLTNNNTVGVRTRVLLVADSQVDRLTVTDKETSGICRTAAAFLTVSRCSSVRVTETSSEGSSSSFSGGALITLGSE